MFTLGQDQPTVEMLYIILSQLDPLGEVEKQKAVSCWGVASGLTIELRPTRSPSTLTAKTTSYHTGITQEHI